MNAHYSIEREQIHSLEELQASFGLAGALVGLLVTLAPVLILLWLVTR